MTEEKQPTTTIVNYMIVVFGAAFAFTAWRFVMSMDIWRDFPVSLQWYYFQALGGVAFLAPLSLTLLAVALRQSGPTARGVVDGPAGILGVTVLFVLLINTLLLLTIWLLAGWSAATFTGGKVLYYCRLLAEQTGMAIGSVGIARALDCRWRRPTGWVAISAWALGGSWILLSVLSASFTLL
jgi:hypothetical protein